MSAEAPAVLRSFKVGHRICTIALRRPAPGQEIDYLMADWSPDAPARLTDEREIAEYRAGRDAAVAELAELIGGNIAIAEI